RVIGLILDLIGRLIVEFGILPAAKRRERLEAHDGQQPGGDGGSAFEFASLTPYIEKNLADKVFGDLFVPHEPQSKPKDLDVMAPVQHLHGEAVAMSDPGNQSFIGSRLCRAHWPSRGIGRDCRKEGSIGKVKSSQFTDISRPAGAGAFSSEVDTG